MDSYQRIMFCFWKTAVDSKGSLFVQEPDSLVKASRQTRWDSAKTCFAFLNLPGRIPKFLTDKRNASRAYNLKDFARPVKSKAEKDLYFELYNLHTKKTTDFFRMLGDYNCRVYEHWCEVEKADLTMWFKEDAPSQSFWEVRHQNS